MANKNNANDNHLRHCSFCGRNEHQVSFLIPSQSGAYICDLCVEQCSDLIDQIDRSVPGLDSGKMSLSELNELMKNNWEGEEALRITAKNKFPKYGTGNVEVDGYAADIVDFLGKEINKKPILPTEVELESNPRSRSAKLRVAEKI